MKFESKKSVAFQGEHGAFSEMAVFNLFGKNTKVEPSHSFQDVFDKVKKGKCEYGVVPVENTLGGIVYQVWDLLNEYDLSIVGETKVQIEHCLIVNPGTKLADIRTVYAHYQVVLQCENFLRKNKKWVVENAYDTAGSVKIIKELGTKGLAAIASERAAEFYNMPILKRGVQDYKENYTRFIVLSKKPVGAGDKFTLMVSLTHKPGSLLGLLGVVEKYNINLTSIHSRPNKKKPFEYLFFLEGLFSKLDTGIFSALKKKSKILKRLGTYPSNM